MTKEQFEMYKYMKNGGLGNGCGPTFLCALVIAAMMLLASCKSVQYIPVEKVRTEYKTKTDTFIQKDSVLVKDSVFIHSKNDTVWYEKWHTKYLDRVVEKIKTDTVIKVDSIQVPYPVERQLNKWESFCLEYGKVTTGMSIALVLLGILWLIWLIKRKL